MNSTFVDVSQLCSLNPAVDVGQVEGAFTMGLGYFLTEELKYDVVTGQNLTDGTWVCVFLFCSDMCCLQPVFYTLGYVAWC